MDSGLLDKIEKIKNQNIRFIIVTGGVCSSIGKGVLLSSLGVLHKNSGIAVAVAKFDPYLNVDPGTMSPLVHGEVFVTADGAETDLDLGHYERMIDLNLTHESSVSSGQIFQELLQGEREGKFLGTCIQLIPHAVDAIKNRLLQLALNTQAELVLLEIGGTVGDIEGEIFLEALRQLRMELNPHQLMHCHLSYVPFLAWSHEVKTKPTQHSVMLLKKSGLIPDALFLRTEHAIPEEALKKVSVMCGVKQDLIFQVPTCKPIYQLFIDLKDQQVAKKLQTWLGITNKTEPDLHEWRDLIARINQKKETITVGLVVKYIGSNDPYISVIEAIKSAAYACEKDAIIVPINAEALELEHSNEEFKKAQQQLDSVDGIIVPGGFGKRGVQGKIYAAQWARETQHPYLGICLGMQTMLIEVAQNLLHNADANSTEFDPETEHPIIALLNEQQHIVKKGGTMRLGTYACDLTPGSKAAQAYGATDAQPMHIHERHRHRYEYNNDYREQMEKVGIRFSGINPERNLVEIVELVDHPFMVGSQFHPEFLSRPLKPHPLFMAFIKACIDHKKSKK